MNIAEPIWKSTTSDPPQEGKVVLTKIDDDDGCRNVQPMKRHVRLWFLSDGSMYVYYTPTHWMEIGQ